MKDSITSIQHAVSDMEIRRVANGFIVTVNAAALRSRGYQSDDQTYVYRSAEELGVGVATLLHHGTAPVKHHEDAGPAADASDPPFQQPAPAFGGLRNNVGKNAEDESEEFPYEPRQRAGSETRGA